MKVEEEMGRWKYEDGGRGWKLEGWKGESRRGEETER